MALGDGLGCGTGWAGLGDGLGCGSQDDTCQRPVADVHGGCPQAATLSPASQTPLARCARGPHAPRVPDLRATSRWPVHPAAGAALRLCGGRVSAVLVALAGVLGVLGALLVGPGGGVAVASTTRSAVPVVSTPSPPSPPAPSALPAPTAPAPPGRRVPAPPEFALGDLMPGQTALRAIRLAPADRLVGVTWLAGPPLAVAVRWHLPGGFTGWESLDDDTLVPEPAERALARPGTEPSWRPAGADRGRGAGHRRTGWRDRPDGRRGGTATAQPGRPVGRVPAGKRTDGRHRSAPGCWAAS